MSSYKTVRVGDRWNSMVCTAVYEKEKRFEYPGGGYDPYWEWTYKMRCDCGREVEVARKEFTGKRVWRDCGQCGTNLKEGRVIPTTLTLPYSLIEKLQMYADKNTRSVLSHAAVDVLKIGFKEIEKGDGNGYKN